MGEEIWLPSPQGYMPMSVYMKYLENIISNGEVEPQDTPPTGNNPQGTPSPEQGEDIVPDNTTENSPQSQTAKAAGGVVVCDIDGTLTKYDGSQDANENTVLYLKEMSASHKVIIVSSRSVKRLEETTAWLNANEVPHDSVYLSDFPTGAGLQFKRYRAGKIIKDSGPVAIAIDNDEDVRAVYRDLGVSDVKAPEDLPKVKRSGKRKRAAK